MYLVPQSKNLSLESPMLSLQHLNSGNTLPQVIVRNRALLVLSGSIIKGRVNTHLI